MKFRSPLWLTKYLLGSLSIASGQIFIDDHFDDATVSGWRSLGNTLGATHNLTENGSTITSEVIATQPNHNTNRGIVSTASFDPSNNSGGFSMTFEVTSQGTLAPGANGLFLGLTTSDSIFFRTRGVSTFGLVFFGHADRTQSQNGVSLVTNDIGNGGPATEVIEKTTFPGENRIFIRISIVE